MTLGVIVQARLDSSRLPRKALLPLGGEPLLVRVLEALRCLPVAYHIVACPEDSYDTFKPLAEQTGFSIISGPKDDVLGRFVLALDAFKLDYCIRATADNPFVFVDAAWLSAQETVSLKADYGTLTSMPYGSGVEIIRAEALRQADQETLVPYDREHVCPYLYNNPGRFHLHRPLAPQCWREPEIRLTVDTREDYKQAQRLYDALLKAEAGIGSGTGASTGADVGAGAAPSGRAPGMDPIPLRYQGAWILKIWHQLEGC